MYISRKRNHIPLHPSFLKGALWLNIVYIIYQMSESHSLQPAGKDRGAAALYYIIIQDVSLRHWVSPTQFFKFLFSPASFLSCRKCIGLSPPLLSYCGNSQIVSIPCRVLTAHLAPGQTETQHTHRHAAHESMVPGCRAAELRWVKPWQHKKPWTKRVNHVGRMKTWPERGK